MLGKKYAGNVAELCLDSDPGRYWNPKVANSDSFTLFSYPYLHQVSGLKAVFDISVLGMGHYEERARTGIARVVENLALALDQRTDLDLYFSAYESLETHIKTQRFLESQNYLTSNRLVEPESRLGKMLVSLYMRTGLTHPRVLKSRNLVARLNRKLQRSLQLNSSMASKFADLTGAAGKNIFHTPFLPFPRSTNKVPRLKRFLTIYDLIPILYPEYFTCNETRNLKSVIGRVTRNDFVLAISQSTKNDLCDYAKIDSDRVFVTPLAASDTFAMCPDSDLKRCTREKYGIPESPYVLSLCTLEPRKNIDQAIRSFCHLVDQEKIHDLNLVLVGVKGWKYDRIFDEIVQAVEMRDRIFVTGYVPDEDLSPLYSGAMMFIYPSFYEGFGLPPLEAMQCGLPVITSNTSSLPEVVGDAGIMIDPSDDDALCQAMKDLYDSYELRSRLSAKGLKRAAMFSWEKCADETVKAYQVAVD